MDIRQIPLVYSVGKKLTRTTASAQSVSAFCHSRQYFPNFETRDCSLRGDRSLILGEEVAYSADLSARSWRRRPMCREIPARMMEEMSNQRIC